MGLKFKEAYIYFQNNILPDDSSRGDAAAITKELTPQLQRLAFFGDNQKEILHTLKSWRDYLLPEEADDVVNTLEGKTLPLLSQIKKIPDNYQPGDIKAMIGLLLGKPDR